MKPKVIRRGKIIAGTKYVELYTFRSKHEVPIYEILNCHGLNQIIGYIKLINRNYGKVYYRGQCNLHDQMLPSLYHESQTASHISKGNGRLNKIIKKVLNDKHFMREANLDNSEETAAIIVEAILQHYGINTRCIDAVDNHWIALWFGLNKYYSERIGKVTYASYTNRFQNGYQLICDDKIKKGDLASLYQYLILVAVDSESEAKSNGVSIGNDMITVDLRIALPSTFLRPHAQHGVILKRRLHDPSSNYDISKNVVGILKIRIDLVEKWLGNGELVKFDNLFPSQFHDHAYRILLEREDLFNDGSNSIIRYIYE